MGCCDEDVELSRKDKIVMLIIVVVVSVAFVLCCLGLR
jgi:hypothetical protein